MNIAKCKLDKRGRITIPLSFFKANDMIPEDYDAVVQVVMNNLNTVKLVFSKKGEA
jgi:hypothetical protein